MKVEDLSLNPNPQPTRSGARVLATFSLRTSEMLVRDFMYAELPSGTRTLWSPKSRRTEHPLITLTQEARYEVLDTIAGHLADLRRLAA